MKSKNITILIVLVLVGVIAWAMFNSKDVVSPDPGLDDTNLESNQNSQPQNEGNDVVVEEVPNALEGELKNSSDKRRGNYMLLLKDSDRIIYLNTSRDYSSLVNKNVIVEIEGTMDDFRLVDIKSR